MTKFKTLLMVGVLCGAGSTHAGKKDPSNGWVKAILNGAAATMNAIDGQYMGSSGSSSSKPWPGRGIYPYRLVSDTLRLVAKDPSHQFRAVVSTLVGIVAYAQGASPEMGMAISGLGVLPALQTAKRWNGEMIFFDGLGPADVRARNHPVPLGVGTEHDIEYSPKNWRERHSSDAVREKHRREELGIPPRLIQSLFNGDSYIYFMKQYYIGSKYREYDNIAKNLRKEAKRQEKEAKKRKRRGRK